jgi:hypothetical protein
MVLSEDMALGEGIIGRLKEVLRETTALVFVDRQPVGTAFFISDELLLTCAHVVQGQAVEIWPYERKRRPAQIIRKSDSDLALLRSLPGNAEPSPCVVLGQISYPGRCFVAGYPRAYGDARGSEVFDVSVYMSKDLMGGDQTLVIEPGPIITWGMSGGPVVSAYSGAVIGVVRTSKDPQDALGGGAIPISRAAEAFSEVEDALQKPTSAIRAWRDVLGRDNWQRLGMSWNTEDRIDLHVSGALTRWVIRIEQDAKLKVRLGGGNLGEEVAEAIFHWARRRHARGPEEVALLGRLLGSALFPRAVRRHLVKASLADSVLVRLHVEEDNILADIPWELAVVPLPGNGEDVRFLAEDRSLRFARVVDKPDNSFPPVIPKSQASVLLVVAQPPGWKHKNVLGPHGGTPDRWPSQDTMRKLFSNSIDAKVFTVGQPRSPGQGSLHHELEKAYEEGRPYDVLHYIGTGHQENGKASIVFVGDHGQERWEDVRNVLDAAARFRVRLIVVELMLPPEDHDLQQLSHRAFRKLIRGSVEAAVLTNLPVHPEQCEIFNSKFYESLGRGETVETAAQLARRDLYYDKPVGDAAGFGCFSIVTGPQSDIRLVSPRQQDPTVRGAQQLGADGHASELASQSL